MSWDGRPDHLSGSLAPVNPEERVGPCGMTGGRPDQRGVVLAGTGELAAGR